MTNSKNLRIVLVKTSHPGNIGSVARAMKTMGLEKLVLVNPKKFPDPQAMAMAGNATDVLANAEIFSSLQLAIASCTDVYAASARERTIAWPTYDARLAAEQIHTQIHQKKEIAIVFGREARGLTNDELQLANYQIIIPANPDYPVLNLAMSVQIIAYELFFQSAGDVDIDWQDFPELNADQLQQLIDHFIETSYALQLFDEENAKKIQVRIMRMFRRLKPDTMEGNFLRGFLTRVNKKIK